MNEMKPALVRLKIKSGLPPGYDVMKMESLENGVNYFWVNGLHQPFLIFVGSHMIFINMLKHTMDEEKIWQGISDFSTMRPAPRAIDESIDYIILNDE